MKWQVWLLRLVLLANPLILVTLQLSRLNTNWQQDSWRLLPLVALIALTAGMTLLSVTKRFTGWFKAYQQRTAHNRLIAWGTALAVFVLYSVLVANALQPIVDNNAEILRILGGANAIFVLWLYQFGRSPLPSPMPTSPQKQPHDRKIVVAIIVLSAVMSAWQFTESAPWVMDDSSSYYGISRQILDAEFVPQDDFPGLYAASPFSYSYALAIAISRLFADSILSIVIFQHALRAVLAAAAFWMLRDIHYALAVFAGFLLALAAPTLHFAHLLLADSLYTSLLLWFTLLACRILCKPHHITSLTILFAGIAGGFVAWMRPVGALVLVGLFLLFVLRRQWRHITPLLAGFGLILLVASGGRWLLDKHFSPSPPQSDLYYYVPLLHQNLYRPENGSLSTALLQGCTYGELDYQGLLYLCNYHYLAETGSNISLLSVYIEAIRAQPLKFLYAMYSEVRVFIGGFALPWLPRYTPISAYPSTAPDQPPKICGAVQCVYRPDQVVVWAAEHFNQDYARYATTYITPATLPENGLFYHYSQAFQYLIQPYLLAGQHSSAFWAALVLLYFIWIETREKPVLRWLLVFNAFLIAYHAAVTAFANITTYRYVYVLTPQWILLVGILYWLVVAGIQHQRTSSAK